MSPELRSAEAALQVSLLLFVTSAVKDTAGGVIDGVGAVGGAVVKNASGFLVVTVGGVKDVLAAALPGSTP
jgi:hypothetical protein